MAEAEAEVDTWVPLLNALKAYQVVGPMSGREEEDTVWAPIHYAICAYGLARGVRGPVADAQPGLAGGDETGSSPGAALASDGADRRGSGGIDEVVSYPNGRQSDTRSEAEPAVVGLGEPTVQVPVSETLPEQTPPVGMVSTRSTPAARPLGAVQGLPVRDGALAEPLEQTPSQASDARRESGALQGLKELLAARCCHRIAASGSVPTVSKSVSKTESSANKGSVTVAEHGVAERGGTSISTRLVQDADGADDEGTVLSTARTFITGVQTMDTFSADRMRLLVSDMEDPSRSVDGLSVIVGVGLATAAADALDTWSIVKLKERELKLAEARTPQA